MSTVAFVDASGLISNILYPGVGQEYTEGQEVNGGLIARILPDDADRSQVSTTWHWHDNQWKTDKPIKTSKYQYWEDGQWKINTEGLQKDIRGTRVRILQSTDWTQLADAPLTDSKKAEWAVYRQALRDMPTSNSSATSLDAVTWPTEPA